MQKLAEESDNVVQTVPAQAVSEDRDRKVSDEARLQESAESDNLAYTKMLTSVGKGGSIFVAGTIVGLLFEYVTRAIIGRVLGAEEFGLFSLGYSILVVLAIAASLGLRDGVTRFVAFYESRSDPHASKNTLLIALKVAGGASLLVAGLLLVTAPTLANSLFHKPVLASILPILALGVPIEVIFGLAVAALIGFGKAKEVLYSRDLGANGVRLLMVISVLVAFTAGVRLQGVAWSYVLSFAVAAIVSICLVWRSWSTPGKPAETASIRRKLLSFSWPLLVTGFVYEFDRRKEVLFLGYFVPSSQVGLYSAVVMLARFVVVPYNGFSRMFFPAASMLYAQERRQDAIDLHASVTRWVFVFGLPIVMTLLVCGDAILRLTFGPEFGDAMTALRILSLGMIADVATGPWTQIFLVYNKPRLELAARLFWVITNLVLDLILIPQMGLIGAALAVSLSLTVTHLLGMFVAYRLSGAWPFSRFHLKYFLWTATVFGLFYVGKNIFQVPDFGAIAGGALAASVSLLGILPIGLQSDDRSILLAMRAKLLGLTPWRGL